MACCDPRTKDKLRAKYEKVEEGVRPVAEKASNPGIGTQSGRDAKGKFVKGNKSNGGRPKLPDDLKQAFKAAAPDALRVLVEIVNNRGAKDGDRIRAAEVILDRGYGKPTQAVELDGASIPQVVIVGDVKD